jgi:MFS transporter, UMF1 family
MEASRIQKVSWVLIDWANSGYGLITITAVFPPYFITSLLPPLRGTDMTGLELAGIQIPGSAVWAFLTAISMLMMAVAAPIMGAIADVRGWTKRLLIIHTVVGSILTTAMFFLSAGQWGWGAVLYVTSNYCFGASYAFFNAYLPKLTGPEKQGSLSGWGFAAGYVGGALALIIALVVLERTKSPQGAYDPAALRFSVALPGVWWLLFSLPAFFLLPEFSAQDVRLTGSLVGEGYRRVKHVFVHLRQFRMLFLFLLAFLLYNDGVETVIAMASPFGTEVLKMSQSQLITMLLLVQFVAFVGSVGFGYLADWLGNKIVIIVNLLVWIGVAFSAIFITTPAQFTLLGVMIGIVLGGVQASSRALMSLLSPPDILNEAFGFFSISGKFASIFGPLLYSVLATGLGSRMGILSVLPFLTAGLLVLLAVKEPTTTRGQAFEVIQPPRT